MTEITPGNFYQSDTDTLCRWLRNGLEGYLVHDMGPGAFGAMHFRIGTGYDLVDDLYGIFDDSRSVPTFRDAWRDSVQRIFYGCSPVPTNAEVFSVLLSLALRFSCDSIFARLDSCVRSPAYARIHLNDRRMTLAQACFHLAVRRAGRCEPAYQCVIRALSDAPFDNLPADLPLADTRWVLVELCRAAPEDWRSHFGRLSVPLEQMLVPGTIWDAGEVDRQAMQLAVAISKVVSRKFFLETEGDPQNFREHRPFRLRKALARVLMRDKGSPSLAFDELLRFATPTKPPAVAYRTAKMPYRRNFRSTSNNQSVMQQAAADDVESWESWGSRLSPGVLSGADDEIRALSRVLGFPACGNSHERRMN
jgi:hypothetical protein